VKYPIAPRAEWMEDIERSGVSDTKELRTLMESQEVSR
jgi:hypothetical protein